MNKNPVSFGRLRRAGALIAAAMAFNFSWAFATEPLHFNDRPGPTSTVFLERFFQSLNPPLAVPALAAADLNEDGLNEFIAQTACQTNQGCVYLVLAESDGTLIQLGQIPARSLALGSAYSAGVRNIIAYKSGNNDFTPTLYVWEPASRQYMIKEE
jgi:hypothetical protein